MMNTTDVLAKYSNVHGWIYYDKLNKWIKSNGFIIIKLERHNLTDGEVHFNYTNKLTASSFDFNGNYYDKESFNKLIEWLNKNITK